MPRAKRRLAVLMTAALAAMTLSGSSPATSVTVPAASPVTKEIALELVSTAENATKSWRSAYGYIEDIGDGRGLTAGIVGWCSGTGDMLTLVQYHTARTPGNRLAKYVPALKTINASAYLKRPALSKTLLGAPFMAAWAAEAKTAAFQFAQRWERNRVYWNPAQAAAIRDGLGATGLYIYYDISVNHGPGEDSESFGGIISGVKARGIKSPAQGGSEAAYLLAIVNARDVVLKGWGDYQADGRSTIARKFLKEKNLTLKLPLAWRIYGESFSITVAPKP